MKKIYDGETDSLMIIFKEGEEDYYEEIAPGFNMEFNSDGEVIGMEVLNASKYDKKEVSDPITESNITTSSISFETDSSFSYNAKFITL